MKYRNSVLYIFAILFSGTLSTFAQEATEMFIPIGKSPGISDSVSHIGTIDSSDQKKGMIVVACHNTHHTFIIDKDTPLWIDRSHLKQSNLYGTTDDLIPGRKVEVCPLESGKSGVKWVKVQP